MSCVSMPVRAERDIGMAMPWARAVCTLPAVPRSTQPSILRGTVNEYELFGLSNNNKWRWWL